MWIKLSQIYLRLEMKIPLLTKVFIKGKEISYRIKNIILSANENPPWRIATQCFMLRILWVLSDLINEQVLNCLLLLDSDDIYHLRSSYFLSVPCQFSIYRRTRTCLYTDVFCEYTSVYVVVELCRHIFFYFFQSRTLLSFFCQHWIYFSFFSEIFFSTFSFYNEGYNLYNNQFRR